MERTSRRGATLVEFTLVGIPVIFVLISIVEMSRGMWNYHTLTHAVQATARYVAVHGAGCAQYSNTCAITVGTISHRLADTAIGISPADINLTLTTGGGAQTSCNPVSTCFGNTTLWPPNGSNDAGADIQLDAVQTFRSALSLFWPGQGSVQFAIAYFPANSRQQIEF